MQKIQKQIAKLNKKIGERLAIVRHIRRELKNDKPAYAIIVSEMEATMKKELRKIKEARTEISALEIKLEEAENKMLFGSKKSKTKVGKKNV